MNVGELKALLASQPDDAKVVIARDRAGAVVAELKPAHAVRRERYRINDRLIRCADEGPTPVLVLFSEEV